MKLWSRLGRSGRNMTVTASSEVVIRMVGLAYLMVLARFLEPGEFGVFNTLLAYFALAVTLGNFGLDRLALRELSVDSGTRVFGTLLWLRVAAAMVTAGLLLVGALVLTTPSAPLFTLLALAVLPAGIGSAFTAAFQAREEFGVPAAAAAAGTSVMAALALAGVALDAPLSFFLWALAAAEGVRASWLAVAARRRGGWSVRRFDAKFAATALRSAVPYGVLAVLGAIYFRVDLIMLDAMVGGDELGHYASAYRVLDALILVPGLLLGVLFPRFARVQRMRDPAEARVLYLSMSRVLVWAGIALGVTGIVFADPILRLLFSDTYAGGRSSLVWLMVALTFVFWHAANVTVLFAGDRLGATVRLSFVTAGFNVALNLLLIPHHGAAGAAAATAASELLSWGVFTPMVLRRLSIRPLEYARSLSTPGITRAELRLLLGHEAPSEGPGGGSGAR